MDFFRAVPTSFDTSRTQQRVETRRLPSNVPYVIDNLWEYLRPANKPSRRHAVYASPSVDLATQNASATTESGYTVYRLVFQKPPAFMQLSVTDARYHPDIKALQQVVHTTLGAGFGSLPLEAKLAVAPLFLPGVSPAELQDAAAASWALRELLERAAKVSTFWQGADTLDPSSTGELFFELEAGNSYTLQPL